MQKRTSLCELLDQFVDAQQLDIKAYSSGHLNESKLFHPPNHAPHYLWSGHNQLPMSVLETNAKSQNKVKKDASAKFTHADQMKHCYKLKPLKSEKLPQCVKTVDINCMTSSEVYSGKLSTTEPKEDVCQMLLDDHISVEKQCLPSQINSKQKTATKLFDTASAAELEKPVSGICPYGVAATHFRTATKKDQFRKMRDYHNNVIQHPTFIHQHAVTGSDAVKYLEQCLHKV